MFSADRIASVIVRGHPLLCIRTDRPDVTTGRAAKVSAQHSVAVALIYGAAGLPQYTDRCIGEPAVLKLRRKVTVEEGPNIPIETAFVSVQTTDDRRFECHVTQSRGNDCTPDERRRARSQIPQPRRVRRSDARHRAIDRGDLGYQRSTRSSPKPSR